MKLNYRAGAMHVIPHRSLNIITALNCEAKPIIDFYRLYKVRSRPFDYYTGHAKVESGQEFSINLLVCGLGVLNMSTACGWLAAQTDQVQTVWLNVGTAGHEEMNVGEILRVHRVVDIATGKSHYPAMTAKWSGLSSVLITYESACIDYPQDALVDMEGSAFFSSAGLFATTELVQSLKIVSDNETESVERLNASLISQLIAPHALSINEFVMNLIGLLPQDQNLSRYMSLIAHLHCTVSQRQQYSELLCKLESLHLLDELAKEDIKKINSMSDLLKVLNEKLHGVQPSLTEMVCEHG